MILGYHTEGECAVVRLLSTIIKEASMTDKPKYDPQLSLTLLLMARIPFVQRSRNQPDIFKLRFTNPVLKPGLDKVLDGYQQVGAFRAPEMTFSQSTKVMNAAIKKELALDHKSDLDKADSVLHEIVETIIPNPTYQFQ